jgi:cytochrome c-type biogenesis protein CcmH/NrfF
VTVDAARLRSGLRVAVGVVVCCSAVGWAHAAQADDAAANGVASKLESAPDGGSEGPPRWAYALAYDLMSPFCPGRTLAACSSPQAGELRQWILLQAVAGRSRVDIEKSLYDRYGDDILGAPRASGWGLSAYLVPALAFVLGGGLVFWALSRLVGRGPAASTGSPSPAPGAGVAAGRPSSALRDAELERLVDEELARL